MSNNIKPIETLYHGYRFRSRLEARWAVFFDTVGLEYQYEPEGYEMDDVRYLPDFYIPSLDRWIEVKGTKLNLAEIKKCEEFCRRKDNNGIKFSVVIGVPTVVLLEEFDLYGIEEYTWEWPSKQYPNDTLFSVEGLVQEEYYSRFIRGVWVLPCEKQVLITAAEKARSARFEFGEHP